MSLVPNRTPQALGKAFAGEKMPAGTRLGTAALDHGFSPSCKILITVEAVYYYYFGTV